jgi:hypothetical protein
MLYIPTPQRHVLQFKVTLMEVEPSIWRRIVVPERYSFWDLHVAIQDAMGWIDCHLHQFDVMEPSTGERVQIGIPSDDDWDDVPMLPGWKLKIADCFVREQDQALYEYDFGDGWEHSVVLESRLPADPRGRYPMCTGGERHCPPEDCGGVDGYEELLAAIRDPRHERHRELLKWVGGGFDPDAFDHRTVRFDNPRERLKSLQVF